VAGGSPRREDLLAAAYAYASQHGLADLSLRPLAAAIGSSPRVLLYLFGSKEGLIKALLQRSRSEELQLLAEIRAGTGGVLAVAERIWDWLSAGHRRGLLSLWLEAYARSLVEPDGAWADFARSTVADWLELLASRQSDPDTAAARSERTLVLAVLRGALIDLLATGETQRVSDAVGSFLGSSRSR
jgi:AcrR family transcriptional regulator